MTYISRLKLTNFKRFKFLDVKFQNDRNILVGNNASGKSSILQAIDICLTANRRNVEEENLKFLINAEAISDFLNLPTDQRTIEALPILKVELFLEDLELPDFVGSNNSEGTQSAGLKLVVEPDVELGVIINEIINNEDCSFPFEFYQAIFTSFQGGGFSKYRCPINHLLVDHSEMGAVSATNNFVRNLFKHTTSSDQQNIISHKLRENKETFNNDILQELTPENTENFVLRTDKSHAIAQSISIESDGVDIMHEGKGGQSLIKTKFALERRTDRTNVLLIEEPENHLSHSGMAKLLKLFNDSHKGQTIISTHNSLIASGLRLNNLLIVGENTEVNFPLSDIDPSTADFFSKAPDHLLLEFILSNKVLLVEGAAEYIIMPEFYERLFPGRSLDSDNIHLISVGGIKFKRYLSISNQLNKKTAIIQDNDGKERQQLENQYLKDDDETSIIDPELNFLGLHNNPEEKTLEEVLYSSNQDLYNELFRERTRTNTTLQYLLANKANVALEVARFLKDNPLREFIIPEYIENSFRWLQD